MGKPTDVGAIFKASRERQERDAEDSWGANPQSSWFPESGRSPDFFPPDVRVWVDQDIPNTDPMAGMNDPMLGVARQLLHRALLMKERGVTLPVRLFKQIGDNLWVGVVLTGDQKIVRITTQNPLVPKKKGEELPPPTIVEGEGEIYMLCGISKTPTQVIIDTETYSHVFAPTAATSSSRSVPFGYHDNKKLGDTIISVGQPRGSEYSGTMKRVVQAVQGMGKIRDASLPYIQTTPPQELIRSVEMQYYSRYSTTHGVYKAGPKNHWLVEISLANGVLAMPLPIINSTRAPGYRIRCSKIGDIGGLAVVDEFGGLPSGETFPSGADLTTAIADGKILRLLTVAQLEPFYKYVAGETHSFPYSWAFSDTGTQAHNIRFNYSQLPLETTRTLRGERWAIILDLSVHALTRPPGTPVGTGSASLAIQGSGKLSSDCVLGLWGGSSLILGSYASLSLTQPVTVAGEEPNGWGGPVHVFFVGDQLQVVNWVPQVLLTAGRSASRPHTATTSLSWHPAYGPGVQFSADYWNVVSPASFVTSGIDLRQRSVGQMVDVEGAHLGSVGVLGGTPLSYTWWWGGIYPEATVADPGYGIGGLVGGSDVVRNQYWCIIPSHCREGVAVCHGQVNINSISGPYYHSFDYQWSYTRGVALVNGIGLFGVDVEQTLEGRRPDVRDPAHATNFSVVANAGPSVAYVRTQQIRTTPGTESYLQFNLLPDTGSVQPDDVIFIGSY